MPLARPQPSPREQELRKQHAQFLNVDIEDLIDQLSVEEKINLLGAPDWWSTTAVDRLDIPSVRMRSVFFPGPHFTIPRFLTTIMTSAMGQTEFAAPVISSPILLSVFLYAPHCLPAVRTLTLIDIDSAQLPSHPHSTPSSSLKSANSSPLRLNSRPPSSSSHQHAISSAIPSQGVPSNHSPKILISQG